MNQNGFEIERKFLIKMPDAALLEQCTDCSEIEQTYLAIPQIKGNARVRKRKWKTGDVVYTFTEKQHITDITRVEIEREITEEEFREKLQFADPLRATVKKKRYCLDYKGQLFEIDIYPFWSDKAVMELEMTEESQIISYPADIEVIREVTEDHNYNNSSIASQLWKGQMLI